MGQAHCRNGVTTGRRVFRWGGEFTAVKKITGLESDVDGHVHVRIGSIARVCLLKMVNCTLHS